MRVSEETLNHSWVCMGWWVSGLLVGANKCTKTYFSHFIFPRHPALAALLFVLCSKIIINSIDTKKMRTTPPTKLNIYLSRYVDSIIFVSLRRCSGHQLLYTLTKHVRSNVKIITASTKWVDVCAGCLLYTSPSPRDGLLSRMPSSA